MERKRARDIDSYGAREMSTHTRQLKRLVSANYYILIPFVDKTE